MRKRVRKAVDLLFRIAHKMNADHIRAYAAESSFFIIMSIFPVAMLLLALVKFMPFTQEEVMFTLEQITPFEVTEVLEPMVEGLYHNSTAYMVPWIIVAALWAAGKAVIGLSDGFNSVFRMEEKRNYVILRIRAMFYAMGMILALGISLGVLVFGYDIIDYLKQRFAVLQNYREALTILPTIVAMVLLVILFSIFYAYLPSRRLNILQQIPGAVFASVTWSAFSYVFSIYLELAGNMSAIYGSLTTLVAIMLWLYVCMYLLLAGVEINHYLIRAEQKGEPVQFWPEKK